MRSFPQDGKPTLHRYGRHGEATRETPRSLFALGVSSTAPDDLATVRGFIDQYGGPAALIKSPHLAPYALALYPQEAPARTLALPRTIYDQRQGFCLFRNVDFVTTLYAKAAPPVGWNFPEAGTFRIHGLGTDWAVRSGVGKREQENVVVVHTPENQANGRGRVLFQEGNSDGSGAVSLDLSPVYFQGREQKDLGIRAERAFLVDYSGRCGAPALFVLADRLRGGNDYTWLWHTAGGHVTLSDYGFTITGKKGATLNATFITPAPPRLKVQEANSLCTISARVDGLTANFLVICTIQTGSPPPVLVTGQGKSRVIRVGSQEVRLEEVRLSN